MSHTLLRITFLRLTIFALRIFRTGKLGFGKRITGLKGRINCCFAEVTVDKVLLCYVAVGFLNAFANQRVRFFIMTKYSYTWYTFTSLHLSKDVLFEVLGSGYKDVLESTKSYL